MITALLVVSAVVVVVNFLIAINDTSALIPSSSFGEGYTNPLWVLWTTIWRSALVVGGLVGLIAFYKWSPVLFLVCAGVFAVPVAQGAIREWQFRRA